MHLKRIELTNYRQHRQLDVDFSGNLIAVLGPNGCGKSNLIGAIQFALTGEQPGFTKADLTTWGEKEGSVRLFFTAGPRDEEFCVTRKTNGDVVLKVGDETIKQARKVEEVLREKAGLDKDLIKQIVFVPQKGIDSILFDDPRNRELAFQRLIGIGNASKIYEALRTEIAAFDKPQGFDEAIARSRQQLAEQESVAKKCRESVDRYDAALKTLPSKEDLEAEVDKASGMQGVVDEYMAVSQRLSDAQTLHEVAVKKLSDMGAVSEDEEGKLRNEHAELSAELDIKRKELDECKESVRFLSRMKELADALTCASERYGRATVELNAITGKYKTTIEDDKSEVDRLGAEQVSAESELRSLCNLVREASSDGTCPVCGAQASQEDIKKHLEEKISAAEKTARYLCKMAKEARMAYDGRWAEEQGAREKEKREKNAYDIAFAALQKAKDANVEGCEIDVLTQVVSYKGQTPDDLPNIQKTQVDVQNRIDAINVRMSEISKSLSAIESTKKQAKEARDNAARYAAQVDMLIQSKQASAKRLADMGIDPDSASEGADARKQAVSKARANLDAFNGILRDMAGTKGQLEAAENTIESTKKFIDDLLDKKAAEDKIREKVDVLKRVRDGFHYRELPRIMSQNVMRDLTACVNSYLDQFNAPFVVEAEEEGFGFRCCFIDGRTMPDPHPDASLLSGGQKVALAIAFRMAIYMTFGGELGLLSLDEPTAYLDEASIGHLGELLEKVGAVARNKGLQILMATHEKAIMPFLDTKIDLYAIKKGE